MARAHGGTREARGSTVAVNRRARFDYELLDRYDAGLVLLGSEIKSLRAGKANLRQAFARFQDDELWLFNMHIAPYPPAAQNHDPTRPRKLLLHRRELARLRRALDQQPRATMVAVRLYLERGRAKVEIALARGKRHYDQRQAIAKREADRAIARGLRHDLR